MLASLTHAASSKTLGHMQRLRDQECTALDVSILIVCSQVLEPDRTGATIVLITSHVAVAACLRNDCIL